MKLNEKTWQIILIVICLVYILLRLWRLTDSCLWFDEIFGIHAAEHAWKDLFWFVAQDLIHPPLFYVLFKIWISIGGESLFWLRFFSVFFAAAALVPFYFLCRQLKLDYPTMALAAAFFACNGALVKYAQEARMYSLLLCLSLFSLWLFARFFGLGKSYVALIAVNVLLVYTHYFGWLVVLAEIVSILLLQRIKIRQILIMLGICLLSFAPWIFAVWQAARQIEADLTQNIGWIEKPNLAVVSQFIIDLIEPFYYQASNVGAASRFYISIPLLMIFISSALAFLMNWKDRDETEKTRFYLLGIFVLTPTLSAFILSLMLPYSIWGTRHLIVVFAPAAILSAVFLNAVEMKTLKIGLIFLIFLFFAGAFALQIRTPPPQFIWCGWEKLAQSLPVSEPQKVYVFEDLIAYHFWFALRQNDRMQVIKIKNVEGVEEDRAYFLPRGFDAVEVLEENDLRGERFWIAFRAPDFDKNKPPLKNLRAKGYKIGEPRIFEAQGTKAFLVSVEK